MHLSSENLEEFTHPPSKSSSRVHTREILIVPCFSEIQLDGRFDLGEMAMITRIMEFGE
jgi:hypothetical protein